MPLTTQEHMGACHCGAVEVRYRTEHTPATLPMRRCGCSFCRTHGARASTDPNGSLEITEAKPGLNRYRFGHAITDFLICGGCGAYVGAVMEIDGALYGTLNVNTLDIRDQLDPAPPLADYEAETAQARRDRRRQKWTPARLVTATN